jgi:hypothetical protein
MTYDSYYSARGKNGKQELRQWFEEKAYMNELSKEFGIAVPDAATMFGSPDVPIPAPVVKPMPDDVEEDSSATTGGDDEG